jgi:hypothetical protein
VRRRRRSALLAALAAGCGGAGPAAVIRSGPALALDPASITAPAGTTVLLTVRTETGEAGTIRFTVDTPAVATVDSAPHTIPAGGTTTVAVAAVRPGSGVLHLRAVLSRLGVVTGTIPVTVTPVPACIHPVAISPNAVTLAPGTTQRLRAGPFSCGSPGDTLAVWTSLDTLVASVDTSGLVTARRPGTATVRAASWRAPSIVGVATVTVVPPTR